MTKYAVLLKMSIFRVCIGIGFVLITLFSAAFWQFAGAAELPCTSSVVITHPLDLEEILRIHASIKEFRKQKSIMSKEEACRYSILLSHQQNLLLKAPPSKAIKYSEFGNAINAARKELMIASGKATEEDYKNTISNDDEYDELMDEYEEIIYNEIIEAVLDSVDESKKVLKEEREEE